MSITVNEITLATGNTVSVGTLNQEDHGTVGFYVGFVNKEGAEPVRTEFSLTHEAAYALHELLTIDFGADVNSII